MIQPGATPGGQRFLLLSLPLLLTSFFLFVSPPHTPPDGWFSSWLRTLTHLPAFSTALLLLAPLTLALLALLQKGERPWAWWLSLLSLLSLTAELLSRLQTHPATHLLWPLLTLALLLSGLTFYLKAILTDERPSATATYQPRRAYQKKASSPSLDS